MCIRDRYEILVGSFGTSYTDNRVATIGAIEKAVAKAIPNFSVRRGFTAPVSYTHLDVYKRQAESRSAKKASCAIEACTKQSFET